MVASYSINPRSVKQGHTLVLLTVMNAWFLRDVAVKVSEEKETNNIQEICPIITERV